MTYFIISLVPLPYLQYLGVPIKHLRLALLAVAEASLHLHGASSDVNGEPRRVELSHMRHQHKFRRLGVVEIRGVVS
jgi:hypothetical protein